LETKAFNKYISNLNLLLRDPDIQLMKEISTEYPYFQTARLLYIFAINQVEGVFSNDELKNAAIYATSRLKLFKYLNCQVIEENQTESQQKVAEEKVISPEIKSESVLAESNRIGRQEADQLIERFIKENPSIQKPVSEFYSSVTAASRSITEDEEIATETLAQIHMKQGNYPKAIKIYEKLMLIYPEKSNYFAGLIDTLKDKINE
jgi:tetratricopeptide (TPR) repeat protein